MKISLILIVPATGLKLMASLTASSPGAGSLGHLILEQFKRRAGVDIQHVPAPNSGMLDVLGNHISMSFTTLLTAGEHIRSGGMVALAVIAGAVSWYEMDPATRCCASMAWMGCAMAVLAY